MYRLSVGNRNSQRTGYLFFISSCTQISQIYELSHTFTGFFIHLCFTMLPSVLFTRHGHNIIFLHYLLIWSLFRTCFEVKWKQRAIPTQRWIEILRYSLCCAEMAASWCISSNVSSIKNLKLVCSTAKEEMKRTVVTCRLHASRIYMYQACSSSSLIAPFGEGLLKLPN